MKQHHKRQLSPIPTGDNISKGNYPLSLQETTSQRAIIPYPYRRQHLERQLSPIPTGDNISKGNCPLALHETTSQKAIIPYPYRRQHLKGQLSPIPTGDNILKGNYPLSPIHTGDNISKGNYLLSLQETTSQRAIIPYPYHQTSITTFNAQMMSTMVQCWCSGDDGVGSHFTFSAQ